MIVQLSGKKTVTVSSPVTKEIDKITVVAEIDFPIQKRVVVNTHELGQIVLWDSKSTPSYDAIGQWTDEQVHKRLEELYNK